MTEFSNYITQLNNIISGRRGAELARHMALPLGPAPRGNGVPLNQVHKQVLDRAKSTDVGRYCASNISDSQLAALVGNHLSALKAFVSDSDHGNTYKYQHAVYNILLDYMSSQQGESDPIWVIPVLTRVSNDLRLVAEMADESTPPAAADQGAVRESLQSLTKGFTLVAKDRTAITSTSPRPRRLAIFAVTNILLKIYFKVHTLQLCEKLIRVVEGPGSIMENLHLFPVCDVVTYKYYVGRLRMFEDKYEEAIECLRFAFKHTPKKSLRNGQRILLALLPMEMSVNGLLPRTEVGSVYGLHQLVDIGAAARAGDIRRFETLLEENQRSFLRIGIYLVLEQLKVLVYRNLFKKVYLLTEKNSRVNILLLETVLRALGADCDADEVECVLSNLIYQSKIKGYISHQKRYLIVSKAEPFPSGAVLKKGT